MTWKPVTVNTRNHEEKPKRIQGRPGRLGRVLLPLYHLVDRGVQRGEYIDLQLGQFVESILYTVSDLLCSIGFNI